MKIIGAADTQHEPAMRRLATFVRADSIEYRGRAGGEDYILKKGTEQITIKIRGNKDGGLLSDVVTSDTKKPVIAGTAAAYVETLQGGKLHILLLRKGVKIEELTLAHPDLIETQCMSGYEFERYGILPDPESPWHSYARLARALHKDSETRILVLETKHLSKNKLTRDGDIDTERAASHMLPSIAFHESADSIAVVHNATTFEVSKSRGPTGCYQG